MPVFGVGTGDFAVGIAGSAVRIHGSDGEITGSAIEIAGADGETGGSAVEIGEPDGEIAGPDVGIAGPDVEISGSDGEIGVVHGRNRRFPVAATRFSEGRVTRVPDSRCGEDGDSCNSSLGSAGTGAVLQSGGSIYL